MTLVWAWLWLFAVTVVGSLAAGFVAWLIRRKLRERRKARYFAELSARYRRPKSALPAATKPLRQEELARQMVTVEELVARIEGEGLAVRLRRDGQRSSTRDRQGEEYPTAILPYLKNNHVTR